MWQLLQYAARFIDKGNGCFHYPETANQGEIEWKYDVKFSELPSSEISTWYSFSPMRQYIAGR